MTGHGCPKQASLSFKVIIALWMVAHALYLSAETTSAQTSVITSTQSNIDSTGMYPERVRLRFSWGGGAAQTWSGKISVVRGKFSRLTPLGLTLDAPAAVVLVDQDLVINHWSPTSYGGVDVDLFGSDDAQVNIQITSLENPESRFEQTISIGELASDTVGGEVDSLGNRCSVTRVPGDKIGVEFTREHLVFSPGEPFKFSIRPNLTGLNTRSAVCRVRVVAAHSSGIRINRHYATTLSFSCDANGSAEPQDISFNVPEEESVYNIEMELEPIWYQTSLVSKKVVVRRTIQLIVLENDAATDLDSPEWEEISMADPIESTPDTFPAWSQISRLAQRIPTGSIGNELRQEVVVNQNPMMQLEPGGWQAIPLSMGEPGKPHVVELEYVDDGEMALGISLLQPDASGQIPLYGFDSGVFRPDSIVGSNAQGSVRRHRLTVWPGTKTPYLLVANRHKSLPATFGKVRVFAGPERLEPSRFATAPPTDNRKLMAFYEMPMFPENFGAREQVDESVAEPLDDWRTFHEGAERFIEYLKANAYRGAFVAVACDGSSIYPSDLLAASPTHDNGVFFSTGQDPIRKDVLEMLFRMFEREQLLLVPTLALSGPLSEVERTRKLDGRLSEFELLDINQTPLRPGVGGSLPIYNPLNRKVQHSVSRIVEELAGRYQSYSSFDGVALICRPDTCTLLPGRQWGYDTATIQQFIQSQPDLGPMPIQWSEVQAILLDSHRRQWIDWRSQQMTLWYQSLAQAIRTSLPDGKLYLAPVDIYRNEEIASALSPSLHGANNFEELMQHMGFTKEILHGNDSTHENSIVLLNPHRLAPDQTLASRRVDLGVENSKQAKQLFSQASYAGDLFTHRISWAHFEQLQTQSPFGKQESPLMRLQQMTPAGHFNRQRFVQSIKDRDSRMLVDGGSMISMGEEDALADPMSVYAQLPDASFVDVVPSQYPATITLPLAVRQFQNQQAHYFYVANASPWPMSVTLQVETNSRLGTPKIESLVGQDFQIVPESNPPVRSVSSSNGMPISRVRVVFFVPPFGLVGGRTLDRELNVADFRFELPEDADKVLRKRIYSLQSKLIKSTKVKPLKAIENSDFEVQGEPALAGWDSGQQSREKIQLESSSTTSARAAQSGRASLSMTSDGQSPVWIRSNTFAAPETGRLSISVWLKTNDDRNQPALRLAVEGQSNGASYYRFGSVGSLSNDENANQLETSWKRFAVHFDDLPVDGLNGLRIGFDLMGPGQVSIDNVQVFDRWFDENDAKAITQMLASTGPLLARPESLDSCRRLLEGYWAQFLDHYVDSEEPGIDRRNVSDRPGSELTADVSGLDTGKIRNKKAEKEPRKKVPMFRRFRGFGPQRKSNLK